MSDVIQAARRLSEAARDPAVPLERFEAVAEGVAGGLEQVSAEQARDVIRALGEGVASPDGGRAALVALLCGAMVERGADPAPLAGPLLGRLRAVASEARRFFDACAARVPRDAEPEDQDRAFEEARRQVAAAMPEGAAAWDLLEKFFPPAVALFSASPEARRRGRDLLLGDVKAVSGEHQGAHWLTKMLQVLHDEPYLAIEPETGRGIEGRMSGVAENFQLNVLLMDVFPRRGLLGLGMGRRRVSAAAAAVARGRGPQQTEEVVSGRWNLYAWTALGEDLKLPDPHDYGSQRHWIWNEGVPADIPVFEGRRVVLLGPASYVRTWRSQRAFDVLPADLTVERQLSAPEVGQWLRRFASAPRPSGRSPDPEQGEV